MGIEQFRRKLIHAQHVMRCLAGRVRGGERVAALIDRADRLDKTIDWSPKCPKPGTGDVGQASQRMSRGGKP